MSAESVKGLDPHDVIAGIDIDDLAGDGAGEVRGQEEAGLANVFLDDVAAQRGALFDGGQDGLEAGDAG